MTAALPYRAAQHCVDAIMRRTNNRLTATLRTDLDDFVADLAIVRGVGAAVGRPGEIWDLTSSDQQTVIRIIEVLPDRDIVLQLHRMHNCKWLDMGNMTFRSSLAAPLFVSDAVKSIVKAWVVD